MDEGAEHKADEGREDGGGGRGRRRREEQEEEQGGELEEDVLNRGRNPRLPDCPGQIESMSDKLNWSTACPWGKLKKIVILFSLTFSLLMRD